MPCRSCRDWDLMESYIGLFLSAFLAATVVPFSSEVVLGTMHVSGEFHTWWLLAAASTGNTLGSAVNWCLGRYCLRWQDRRWFPISRDKLAEASRRFNRYGTWSLLLAWVPLIGDPLTFAAGVLRVPFPIFLVLVAISKTGRYLVILGIVGQIMA